MPAWKPGDDSPENFVDGPNGPQLRESDDGGEHLLARVLFMSIDPVRSRGLDLTLAPGVRAGGHVRCLLRGVRGT